MEFLKFLVKKGYNVNLVSFSAIDKYLYNNLDDYYVYVNSDATIVDVAKFTDEISSGYLKADFSIIIDKKTYLFYSNSIFDYPILYFSYNLNKDIFKNIYESFNHIKRKETFFCGNNFSINSIIDASIILSKYDIEIKNLPDTPLNIFPPLSIKEQKRVLISNILGKYSYLGLQFLLEKGFIEHYWREIFLMTKVEQIKDFHPEGNVWQHTLHAFKYLKKKDLILSLALLLHDVGKAFSEEYNGKKFYNHAQIGSKITEKFLKNLEFPFEIIKEVKNLVKYHMLPKAIGSFPESKLKRIKKQVDFNRLFELYRADLSSSYKKLNFYYKAKKIIRKFKDDTSGL